MLWFSGLTEYNKPIKANKKASIIFMETSSIFSSYKAIILSKLIID